MLFRSQQKLNTIIYPTSTEFKVVFAQFNVGQKIFILKYSRDAHFILHTKTIYRHGLTAMAPMTMFIALHYCYDHLYINFLMYVCHVSSAIGRNSKGKMEPMAVTITVVRGLKVTKLPHFFSF